VAQPTRPRRRCPAGFEFGSGFGYSAYWFARALPDDGAVVLTDLDEANLDRAREYLERGGPADLATFEVGDALATAERYDGPFDVVCLDLEKYQYEAAFETMRDAVRPGE
jgi:predicted O-methyltransferase YrrM